MVETKNPRKSGAYDGAGEWTRTTDLLITNQLLCQLSYTGMVGPETGSGGSIPSLSGTRYEPHP